MPTDLPRKIIFINRYFYPDHSATSQLLSDLAFDLASRGQEIHVVTGCQLYGDPHAALSAEELIHGAHVHRVPTSRFGRTNLWGRMVDYLTFYLGATWRLLRLVCSGDVVVVKTDPPMMSVPAAWVVKLKRGVLINWVQDLFPEVATEMEVWGVRFVARLLRRLRNQSLQGSYATVVLGEIMAQRIAEEGVPSDRIVIIDNWADGELIQPIHRSENPLVREWGLEGKFVLGYSGNMGLAHEFETIIDVAEKLKFMRNIAFLFIGEGVARRWLVSEVARRKLTNVHFHPYQSADRLRWSLSIPDVHFVSLQRTLEGLIVPSKFYGIAAAGRPVIHIGDPEGEIARILNREHCGWCFPVGAVEDLATCISRLSMREQEVLAAGQSARRAFDRKYTRLHALSTWRFVLAAASRSTSLPSNSKTLEQPVVVGRK